VSKGATVRGGNHPEMDTNRQEKMEKMELKPAEDQGER